MKRTLEESKVYANVFINLIGDLCVKNNMSIGASNGKLILIDHDVDKTYSICTGGSESHAKQGTA